MPPEPARLHLERSKAPFLVAFFFLPFFNYKQVLCAWQLCHDTGHETWLVFVSYLVFFFVFFKFLFLRFFSTPISSYACTSCSCVCGWRCRCHMQMSPRGTLFYYWTPTPAACRPRPDLANKAVPCPKEAIINQKQHFCHPKSESAVQVCVPESVCQCVCIV